MQKMSANLSTINDAATRLKELNDKYTGAYQEIFASFRQIDSAWDGVDNDAFNEKFNLLEKDFIEMTAFIERVSRHLTLSAQSYDTVSKAGARRAEKLNKYSFDDGGSATGSKSGRGSGGSSGGSGGGGFRSGFSGGSGGGGGGGGSW